MDLKRSSCWNSILEKVRPHIPTVDLSLSPSENEDTVTIYQRPAGLSLQFPEDPDSLLVDDADLTDMLKRTSLVCQSEETVSLSAKLGEDEIAERNTKQRCGDAVVADVCDSTVVELNGAKSHISVKQNVDKFKCYQDFPVLSFAKLDQWDLDNVLQNVKKDELSIQQYVTVDAAKTHAILTESVSVDGDKDRSQSDIMERLVAFCKNQTSKHVSEHVKSQDHIRQNNVGNKSLQRMAGESKQSHQDISTDLRCSDSSEKTPRISPNYTTESKSPVKDSTHKEVPPSKKSRLTVHPESRMDDREVTAKSMLLQKIRAMNRNGNKYHSKYTNHQGLVVGNKEDLKEKTPQPVESPCSHNPEHLLEDKQSSAVLSESRKPKTGSPSTVEQSSPKQPQQQGGHKRHQLKQNLKQKEQQQILKQLEIHRPTHSVCQKQPAGEWTDVLYDFEASHLQSVNMLPEDFKSRGCMLLIVNLSSPGVVEYRDHGTRKHLYPAATKSEIYNTIVAWFLSLVWNWGWFPSLIHLPSSRLNCFIFATANKKVVDGTFCISPGFYWQTVETLECVCKGRESIQELHTEVSYSLGCNGLFLHPLITHYILQLVVNSGLDVCGLRLLYPPQGFLTDSAGGVAVKQRADETCQPVLALAVRGSHAFSVWKDLTGSLYPLLPMMTDSTSVTSQEPPLLYSPPLASQVHRELCLWFSGRLPEGSGQNCNQPMKRVVPLDDRVRGRPFIISRSSAFLCATTKADILLVVSPAVPSHCYGQVLAVCESRGFSLKGLQRLQLQNNGAALLGLTSKQVAVFCGSPNVTLDQEELPSQCLVLLLRKENAMHHSVGLPAALMREFVAQNLLGCIYSRLNGVQAVEPSFCFHTVAYSRKLFPIFVKCMWTVPDPSGMILSRQESPSNYDMEQLVILTLSGKDMSRGLGLLHQVLAEGPEGDAGFRLLGLKWLPVLTRLQAQELSPYEVGEQHFHSSLDSLTSSPALVCALRRMDAFASLRKFIQYHGNLSILMSPTPQVAFRQASLFFENEMIYDPQMLLTVCLFKPRVWNHTLDEMFHKLQQSGLMLVGVRVVNLDRRDALSLLPAESDPSDVEAHVEYLCSGSSLAFCLQGENAVKRLLDVLGQVDSSLWTHRYNMAHLHKGIYGSGSCQKAVKDLKRFFPDGLCCPENSTMRQEQILSMCSDPLASVEREQTCTLVSVAQETPSVESGQNGVVPGSKIQGAFWQTTCLLMPFNAPVFSQAPSQLELLEKLLRSDCHLVAGRMTAFDNEQKKHITDILKASSSGKARTTPLYTASCLIVALQGEKIVTNFDLVLKGIYKDRSDLEDMREMIIYPLCEKEAEQLICYLFDALSPESCCVIVPQ